MSSNGASQGGAGEHVYTCITCSVAFVQPHEQRAHFRSDHHRYNMKRRVANLPPVSAQVFNDKVMERQAQLQEHASQESESSGRCHVCSKSFSSQNAYRDHMQSRKHKENEAKHARDGDKKPARAEPREQQPLDNLGDVGEALREEVEDEDMDEEGMMERAVQRKLAQARRIDPAEECMFCGGRQSSLEQSVEHMSTAHGFFVPERKYLVDLGGLLKYLADKVTVGNVCLWCNGRGRSFHDLGAVRKHMLDKSHCKVAYETSEDQLELSDFYDFRSSYPDYKPPDADGEWEDVESADEDAEDGENVAWERDEDDDEELPDDGSGARYGDSELELVLPSGARLGHRSLNRYYRQTMWQTPASQQARPPASAAHGRALAHRLAGGRATEPVVADRHGQRITTRNRGEAKEATRHIREFRDQQRKEQFFTKTAYRHNHQKHYRDPLLQ